MNKYHYALWLLKLHITHLIRYNYQAFALYFKSTWDIIKSD